MHFLNHLINQNAYSLNPSNKSNFFKKYINFLTSFHYNKSDLYKNYLKGINYNPKHNNILSEIPFLPVRLFKEFDFLSIDKKKIFKTLFSSGTTSNNLSKIYLDKINALNQMQISQENGTILTGLLYINPNAKDLKTTLNVTDTPLNVLDQKQLCPGSNALDLINLNLK